MTVILVTGFGPFPGAPVNPTEALVEHLVRRRRGGVRLVGHVFATSYDAVDDELARLVALHRPDALVMFGLATRRRHVSIEMRARNRLGRAPDASGRTARKLRIDADAVDERRGRAPMTQLHKCARAARVDARLSRDAGFYLCNYLYWRALEGTPRPTIFVHVPLPAPSKARRRGTRSSFRRPTMVDLVRAAEAVIAAVAKAVWH